MYANNKIEIRVSGVSHSLKKELFRIVEQKQKALGTKRYSLSDLVIEVLEDYVRKSYEEEVQEEQREFLGAVAKEVAKIDSIDQKMNVLIIREVLQEYTDIILFMILVKIHYIEQELYK